MADTRSGLDVPVLLYGTALFVSSFLLFWVEPLFTKSVLPLLGGSARVWNTALVFFQVVLLAGYLYAHWTTRLLTPRRQSVVQLVLVAGAAAGLPVLAPEGWTPPADALPIPWLLGLFAVGIGPLFFALSSMAPVLQRWFSRLRHRHSSDPYFLYAASNLGSLLALVAFPFLLEPAFPLDEQSRGWAAAYGALTLLVAAASVSLWRRDGGGRLPSRRRAPRKRRRRDPAEKRPWTGPSPGGGGSSGRR